MDGDLDVLRVLIEFSSKLGRDWRRLAQKRIFRAAGLLAEIVAEREADAKATEFSHCSCSVW
jgi:hypothetical protein